MATKKPLVKKLFLVRPLFFNKKTGQASITLPIKTLDFLKKKPKMVRLEIKPVK